MLGKHASIGPSLSLSHDENYGNFTRQSKIDGTLGLGEVPVGQEQLVDVEVGSCLGICGRG